MSQYPSPDFPPPSSGSAYYQGYDPTARALAPARRAGNLMIAIGLLGLLVGVCAGFASRITAEQIPPGNREEFARQVTELEKQTGVTYARAMVYMAIGSGVPAVLLLASGIGVRAGRRGWILFALVLTGLLLAFLGLAILMDVAAAVHAQSVAPNGCFGLLLFAAFGLQMSWLIQAYRSAGANVAADEQAQLQYWQYVQQQQQMYAQWYAQQQAAQRPPSSPSPPPAVPGLPPQPLPPPPPPERPDQPQ